AAGARPGEGGGGGRQPGGSDPGLGARAQALIVRRAPPSASKGERERSAALDRATEFRVLRAAWQAGVRAPEVLFELAPEDGLGEAYVMRRIGGIAIARKLLRDPPYAEARRKIAGQLGEIVARIHAVDVKTLPPLAHRQAEDQTASLRHVLDTLDQPQPVFELALSW